MMEEPIGLVRTSGWCRFEAAAIVSEHGAMQSASMRRTNNNFRVCSARRCVLAFLVVVHAVVLPFAAHSDTGLWTNREICRAAVKTYFFLDTKPNGAADSGEYFGFRSASGHVYGCLIKGTRAELRWLNAAGEAMNSNSTRLLVRDDILTIQTDMKEESFSAGDQPDGR